LYIGSNKFICSSTISLVDYIGASLLTVGELARLDWNAAGLQNINNWINNVKAATSWNVANAMHQALIPMFKQLPMVPINGGTPVM
jgi:glutathione S-transferase